MEKAQRSRPPMPQRPHLQTKPIRSQSSRHTNHPTRGSRNQTSDESTRPSPSRVRQMKEKQLSYGEPSTMDNKPSRHRSSSATGSNLVSSASPFLQHLINEQRAVRDSRTTPSEHVSCDSRPQTPVTAAPTAGAHSQDDLSSVKQRKINDALSAGLQQPEEMGVREMDQYVHKLNKLNFDLKLEIFHRAQQTATLNKKLSRMQELEEQVQQMQSMEEELQELREVEENNQRLRESNEHLQLELDKRDQAVSEAVDLICELETKIEKLESDRDADLASLSNTPLDVMAATTEEPPPQALTPRNRIALDVPDRTSSWRGTQPSRSHRSPTATPTGGARARRQPSFIRDQKESTSALRSVYLADAAKSRAALSVVSQSETTHSDEDGRNRAESPNLSTLSECSYFDPSLSPTRRLHPDLSGITTLAASPAHAPASKKEASSNGLGKSGALSRVEQWIQPRGDQLENGAANQTPASKETERTERPSLGPAFRAERVPEPSKLRTPTPAPTFGHGRFPPTPDTMSTSHANTRNGSNPSIVAEKSQYDRLYTPFSVGRGLRRRRSADEITTRPSTGTTTDGLETHYDSSQDGFRIESEYRLANKCPSSPQANRFNATPLKTKDMDVPGHGHGDRLDNKPAISNSPPLTPQDWLDAAVLTPVSKGRSTQSTSRGEAQGETPSKSPENEHCPASPDAQQDDELELPPAACLRVRGTDNGSNPRAVSGARRLLSFRLFGRSSTGFQRQAPTPDTRDDNDDLPSPITRISRRPSAGRRFSANLDISSSRERTDLGNHPSSDTADRARSGLRPFTPSTAPKGSGQNNRPCTAGSLEGGATRRSSHGLFGWMRGSGSKDTGDASSAVASSPTQHVTTPTQKTMKAHPQQTTRSGSALAYVSVDGATDSSLLSPPDEGRKSRLPPRRFRRAKEAYA